MPSATPKSSPPLIKGYLPIHFTLPFRYGETVIFIKEHFEQSKSKNDKKSARIFVTNVPFIHGVLSRLFLHSFFQRYGDIKNVTVVPNPRGSNDGDYQEFDDECRFEDEYDEGKFAHVTFTTAKEMRKALSAIKTALKRKNHDITVELSEIKQIMMESKKILNETKSLGENDSDSESNGEHNMLPDELKESNTKHAMILAFEKKERRLIETRESLLDRSNAQMEQFEAEEQAGKAKVASNEMDEDGFVTVNHASKIGSKRELDDSIGGFGGASSGRKARKRRRTKKTGLGASELKDFYRFQTREMKKESLEDLRKLFEEDLANVKKRKEENYYRPFQGN